METKTDEFIKTQRDKHRKRLADAAKPVCDCPDAKKARAAHHRALSEAAKQKFKDRMP